MNNNSLKWLCIEPLSGGMYIGARMAFGKDAEGILSYPGLYESNEKPLLDWLNKHNKNIPYDLFDSKLLDPIICKNELIEKYKNLDVVVAVCLCSGLSSANMSEQRADLASCSCKNNNMKYLANFTLSRLKPKVYIFENAPALFSDKGTDTRKDLNKIAKDNNYSVTYVKTDTRLHDNVQRRERTFVIFHQNNLDFSGINFVHHSPDSVVEYLKTKISSTATQNDIFVSEEPLTEQWDFKFIYNKYKDNWRKETHNKSLLQFIMDNNLDQEYYNFYNNDEKLCHPVKHARNKLNQGLRFFDRSHKNIPGDHVPTIFFKSVQDIIHPTEDRFYTIREIMTFMGMPQDYEWPWNVNEFTRKIGQNVPVLTAKDICEEVLRLLLNPVYKTPEHTLYFYNNIDPKKSYFINKVSSI